MFFVREVLRKEINYSIILEINTSFYQKSLIRGKYRQYILING